MSNCQVAWNDSIHYSPIGDLPLPYAQSPYHCTKLLSNPALEPTPLAAFKIGPILKRRFSSTPLPIYQSGTAEHQPLGGIINVVADEHLFFFFLQLLR
jgi:hypothetical protein